MEIENKNNAQDEMLRDLVDYNTDRDPLVLPEYGRSVQMMVEFCLTLEDREERQRCASSIISIMSGKVSHNGDETEFKKKLWNHLALISNYELDIDYPYEIEKISDRDNQRSRIPYPQHPIGKRHYGSIMEAMTKHIAEIEDKEEREAFTRMIANQMKRSLGKWNRDAMTEEKVLDDLGNMTDGKVSYLPGELHLISDNEILNEVQQMRETSGKKKKKKKK